MSDKNMNEKEVTAINLVEASHHDLGWHRGSFDAETEFTCDEINKALDLMKEDPAFIWTHEYSSYLYRYLQRFPERAEELKQRAAEGRFDMGAGYSMPYTSFVTAEMLVRQFIYGKKWVEKTFPGVSSEVYYNTDIPGIGVQMPQIMTKAGVKYLYASRSWNFDGYRQNEFKQFESLDGTRINAFFMNHYGNAIAGDENGPHMDNMNYIAGKVAEHQDDVNAKNVGRELPMLYCMDCTMPSDFTPRLNAWNTYAKEHDLPQMKYSTMKDALHAVFTGDADLSRDVLKGEWPNKWFYENAASDHTTFMKQREAERYLRSAETLAVIRAILSGSFDAYPADRLEEGWRAADHSCHGYAPEGSIEDFKNMYQKAVSVAKEVYDENLTWLAAAVHTDPAKGDICLVVYNSLSWVRDDVVVMDKPEKAADTFRIVDADGKEALCQLSRDGKIVLQAEAVPAMGYKVYYIQNGRAQSAAEGSYAVNTPWTAAYENKFYSIVPTAEGGALDAVLDKENGSKSLFSVERFKIGELYDFQYDGMGAGEQHNMWQPHDGVSQRSAFGQWICTESGPVRTVFESAAPKTSRGPAVLRLTVYAQIKRIDFDLKLEMDDEGSRQLRLMFPVKAGEMFGADGMIDQSNVKVTYEVPFGAVHIGDEVLPKFSSFNKNEGDPNNVGGGASDPKDFTENSAVRPREVQNWISASDREQDTSVTFSSYNLGWDYQDPTGSPVKTPVLQPIMISTSKACHWLYGKWLQPGEHSFHFSMTSGLAADTAGRRMQVGVNNPLAAVVQEKSGDLLPETGCGISVDREDVVITALKKAEDDDNHIVIRWYEAEGKEGSAVKITLPCGKIENPEKTDLIERPCESDAFTAEGSTLTGPTAPWSIETARFTVTK